MYKQWTKFGKNRYQQIENNIVPWINSLKNATPNMLQGHGPKTSLSCKACVKSAKGMQSFVCDIIFVTLGGSTSAQVETSWHGDDFRK
mgnify:CR=1 FL=1